MTDARAAKAEAERKLAEKARLEKLRNKLDAAEQAAGQNQYDEAIKLAAEILTEDPQFPKAQDRIALWTKKKQEFEEVQRQAAITPQLEKLEADILGYLKEKGFQQARQAADKMLSLDPKSRTAQRLSMRIDAEERAHQNALAEQKIADALAEAERLAEQKDFGAAIKKVRESVLAADPDNPKGAKLIASIEKQIALAEQQKQDAELASAEALIDEGKLGEAVAAINKVKAQYPSLARKADAALAKVERKRLELEKAAEAARVAQGEQALEAALALLEGAKVDEAAAAINKVKAEYPSLAKNADAALAKVERKRLELEKAAEAARVAQAEQAFDAALALLNAGKVDEAEAALRKIDTGAAKGLAGKVAQALEKDVPAAKAQAPLLRARADLAKAESLAGEGKLDEARKTAEGVKATMPDLQREADRVLARIDREQVSQARAKERDALRQAGSLIEQGKLDEAETYLKGLLASQLLSGNKALQALLVTIPAEREKAVAAARQRELEAQALQAQESYLAAMAMLADGKADEGEAALKKIDTGASEKLAAQVAAALEKAVPAARAEAGARRIRAELARAESLAQDGKLDEARKAAEAVKAQQPDFARDADRVLAQIEKLRSAQLKAQEKEAVQRAEALYATGNVNEAEAFLKQVLAGPLAGNAALQELLARATKEREKAAATVKIRQAERDFEAAMALLAAGKVAEAEAALRKIDLSVSKDLAVRVNGALEKDVAAKKAEARLAVGREALEKAKAQAGAGEFDKAIAAAEAIMADYPDLARDAGRLLKDIEEQRYGKYRDQEREVVARSEVLMKAGRLDAAEQLLNNFLTSGPLKGHPGLKAQLAKVGAAKAAVAENSRVGSAEETYEAARQLFAAGKLDEAEKVLRDLKDGFPRSLAGNIDRLLNREIPAARAALSLANGKAELEKADALLADGKLAEARKTAEGAKANFPEAERLVDRALARIAKAEEAVAEAEAKAALAAKIQAAEAELGKAQELVDQDKLADAEKLLLTIPADLSRAITQARDKMLNVEIPKVRRQKQIAEGQQQLARADSLLKEKRYSAARGVATGVKATFPQEVARDAEALIAKIDGVLEQQAKDLLDQAQFEAGEKLIQEYLEGMDPDEAKGLRALLAKVPELRAKAVAGAQEKQLEDLYQDGLKLFAEGNLDGAQKALEQLLAAPGVPDGLAKRARKVLERDIPDRQRELKMAAAKQQLDQIRALVDQGDLAKAAPALEAFLEINPEFEKEAQAIRKALGAKEDEQLTALEKAAVQRAQALIDAGQYDEALQQVAKDLGTPALTASVPLRKLQDAIPALKVAEAEKARIAAEKAQAEARTAAERAQAEARIAEAMKAADAAKDLVEKGELDQAEAALKQIERTLSNDVARKVDQLQGQIMAKREDAAIGAAKARLATAQKALDEGDLAAARTAALAAAEQHRAVEGEAKKLIAKIEAIEREKVLEGKRALLAEGDKLLDEEKYVEALAVYEALEKEGYFGKEIANRKARIKEETQVGDLASVAHAEKVRQLHKAADEAHAEGDFETEKAAIQAVLVWDPKNQVALRRLEQIDANRKEWEKIRKQRLLAVQLAQKAVALLSEAKELEAAQDFEGALAKYQQAIELDPKSQTAREGAARIEGITKGQQAQLALAEKIQQSHRAQLVNKWLKEAETFHQAGRFDEVENLVNRIIALGEGSAPAMREALARLQRREVTLATRPKEGEVAVVPGPGETVEPTDGGPPLTRAEKLLEEISAAEALKIQEKEFQVKTLCDEAEKQLKLNQFDKAIEVIREAEGWDKEDNRVQQLKVKWMILTGNRPQTVSEIAADKEQRELVKMQMNIDEMEKLFRAANTFLDTRDYDEAIDRYEKVRAILRTLPDREELNAYRDESARKLDLARDEKAAEAHRIAQEKEIQARLILQRQRQGKADLEKGQRSELLSRARAQMEQENFGLAKEYANELLNIDPLNTEARSLLSQLDRKRRTERTYTARKNRDANSAELMAGLDEGLVPMTSLYEYPNNWEEIISKRPKSVITEEAEPQWKKEVREQMEKRISFDFVDTPLADVVAFLANLTGTNMVLDPAAVQGDDVPVTLKVNDMRLGAALEWILKLANLTYALRDEVIFISTKERVSEQALLRLYDVRDLLAAIPDYSGTGLPSIGDSAGGGGGGDDLFAGEDGGDGESFTGEDLVEFIREMVAPSSWGGGEFGEEREGGASGTISYRQGKLVIIQTPEIHRQIEDLLSRFRESAALQVHIMARFIEVSENFMRQIGINWTSVNFKPFGGTLGERIIFGAAAGTPTTLGLTESITGGLSTGLRLRTSSFLTENQATGLLVAVQDSDQATTLNAPELTCFNGQQARIAVVRERSYVEDVEITSTATAGGGASQTIDPEISTITTGINFLVRPTVSSDKRYITLDIQPIVSDLEGGVFGEIELTLSPGIPATATEPAVPAVTAPIQLPDMNVQLIQTSVSVPDGGTLLIGGLMRTTDSFTQKGGVPYLDRIPILRALVSGAKTKERKKSYLIILITANVLVRDEMEPPERG